MDVLSRVTLALAVATFLLAGVAVWSILQTRRIRLTELRNRVLDEIIQWAIDVAKCGLDKEAAGRLLGITYTIETFRSEEVTELLLSFKAMSVRSEHARASARVLGDSSLEESVQGLVSDLEELACRLTSLSRVSGDATDARRAVAEGKSALDESAVHVVQQTTEMKLKDGNTSVAAVAAGSWRALTPSNKQPDTERRLAAIERHIRGIKHAIGIADVKWGLGLGITAMVLAYNWLEDSIPDNNLSGSIIGILGLLLICWTVYSWVIVSLWRRWKVKRNK